MISSSRTAMATIGRMDGCTMLRRSKWRWPLIRCSAPHTRGRRSPRRKSAIPDNNERHDRHPQRYRSRCNMTDDILDIPKLAKMLGKTEAGCRQMARDEKIPGRKLCGEWTFYLPAILEFLSQTARTPCQPSTVKPVRPTGISPTRQAAGELDKLLAPPTKRQRKSTQTRSQQKWLV